MRSKEFLRGAVHFFRYSHHQPVNSVDERFGTMLLGVLKGPIAAMAPNEIEYAYPRNR